MKGSQNIIILAMDKKKVSVLERSPIKVVVSTRGAQLKRFSCGAAKVRYKVSRGTP